MHDLVARMCLATHLAPDVIADLEPAMFEALSDRLGFELRSPDGVH